MRTAAVPTADRLIFSPESLVRDYIGSRFLEKQREVRTPHWIGKLMTMEIILRQLSTGWRKPIP